MPASWSSSFSGASPGLSANDIGRSGLAFSSPFIQGTGGGQVGQGGSAFRTNFAQTPLQASRPYSEVGKMSINLGSIGVRAGAQEEQRAPGGFIEGIGRGAGELIGGVFGKEAAKTGGDIGGFIGSVGQVPLDIAANLTGAVPALPGLAEVQGGKSIFSLPFMSEEDRKKTLEGFDGNPFTLARHMSDVNRREWADKIAAGDINPLFADLAPASSLGDQIGQIFGALGLASNAVQRTLAGGPLNAVDRIVNTDDKNLNPEIVDLKHQFQDGTMSKDRFLDELVMHNAGYSNDWGLNLLGSMFLDPLLIGGTVAGMAGKLAIAGRLAKSGKFVEMIGEDAVNALSKGMETAAKAEGRAIESGDILREAERLGLHKDAIAEAARQISAKDSFGASIAHLEPVFNAAQNVSDPFRMIGRMGSSPVLNAWKTSQATMAVANAFNTRNFRAAQSAFADAGIKNIFDDAAGYFTAQEGMLMEGEKLGEDVMAVRQVTDARPSQVAEARLQAGSKNYGRQLEAFVSRRKYDLVRVVRGESPEAALNRAKQATVGKLTKMGLDPERAAKLANDLDADGLSLIDAAYYGHKIKLFNEAKRAAQEARASKSAVTATTAERKGPRGAARAAAAPTQPQIDNIVERTTFIGPREMTSGRAASLRTTLEDASVSTAEKADIGREAIRKYDELGLNFTTTATDEEIVTSLTSYLDNMDEHLTKEMTDSQLAMLPDELKAALDPEDGYIYGMRPEGEAEWRVVTDPEDPSKVIQSRPWMDTVGDKAQPWNTRFNQNGTRIETMGNALERAVGGMSRQITTDRIFGEARQAFIKKVIGGYSPTQTSDLTLKQAQGLWQGVIDVAKELQTSPRGMDLTEYARVLKKVPGAAEAGITPRDLMGMSLHAFEGRLSTVGVTQKITGGAKRLGFDVTGMNSLGRMAERMYPMVRFSMNPFFQIQEWIEPWVFSAARGKKARLTGGWVDPITGTKVEATEVMRLQDSLIQRYAASNPYAQFDQMERSMVYLWGSKAAKDAARKIDPSKIEVARDMLGRVKSPGDRKAVAESEMFRHFLGPTLKAQLNSVNPSAWLQLEMEYGTRDLGTIAVRYLTEKDVWANIDPKAANVLTEVAKAKRIGARSIVDLDTLAEHGFKTTRPALTLAVKDGTMTLEDFAARLTDIGAHEDYIGKAWKGLQFDVKTGGLDEWWAQAKKAPSGRITDANIAAVRSLVQRWAEVAGVSEHEFISRNMHGDFLTLMHDDLIDALDSTLSAHDALFQTAEHAANYFTIDANGARLAERLTPEEARARFLSRSANPPADLPKEHWGAYDDMQEVQFGDRVVFIPGGQAALDDVEKAWTVWEAHIIRAQMINPNDLTDLGKKHALYEKAWRGHTVDMADSANVHSLFNNTVMAMTSSQMNLTRNEMIASRLRVTSPAELKALAGEAKALRQQIIDSYPPGADIPGGDIGLAYSTAEHMANYIPLDRVDDYAKTAYRSGTAGAIQTRARVAAGYIERANMARHAKLAKDFPERRVGRVTEWAIDQAADAINSPTGIDGLHDLPAEMGVDFKKIIGGDAVTKRYVEAAAKVAEDPFDIEARKVLQELVEPKAGGKKMDDVIAFKPWNVNGAGRPHLQVHDGTIAGHGDSKLFAYIKNDDVKWRNTTTNAGIGNALRLAEDMTDNPQHYVRRQNVPAAADPTAYMDEMNSFIDAVDDSAMTAAEAKAAQTALVTKHGVTVGYRYPEWGVSHGASGAMTGEAAAIMGIDGYTRSDLLPSTVRATENYLKGIAESEGSDMPLFSGQRVEGRPLPEVGSTVDLPLVATTPDKSMAHGFSRSRDYRNKMPGYVVEFAPGTKATAHSSDEFLTAGRFKVDSIDEVPYDTYYGMTGHPDAPPVQVVKMSHVEAFDPATKAFAPVKPRTVQEPLDEMAERISHRTRGLSLKTSFFGVDLGDPMAFNRGVMDTHMVGDLTEHMYHDLTQGGTTQRWTDWLASLSPQKQTLIQKWLDRGAPRGAGTFDWEEATGLDVSFKPSTDADKALVAVAKRDGDTATLANWARTRLDGMVKGRGKVTQVEADRLHRLYRNDAEWAELAGRDIQTFGGDYRIYEDLMTERKAGQELTDPTMARHGNGGYQWKMWDDRRNIFDPEIVTYKAAHGLPKRNVKILAASDDAHGGAGFLIDGGLKRSEETGERFLDPYSTAMYQKNGSDAIRGATIFADPTEKVIALTEHADASTLVHEMTHALLEPMLDPSGKQVVLDDLNATITAANASVVERMGVAKAEVDRMAAIVAETQNALLDAEKTLKTAKTDATTKVSAAEKVDRRIAELRTAISRQEGVLAQSKKDMIAKRKAADAAKYPSGRTAAHARLDKVLPREQGKLDALKAQHDELTGQIDGLWDEANAAQNAVPGLEENAGIIRETLRQNKAEGEGYRQTYDELAITPPKSVKDVWDTDVSEHFANQFSVWLATGKAPNVKMRDAFAYFHRVLTKLKGWLDANPQVKVSPAMDDLFKKLHTPEVNNRVIHANAIPFDATQEAMHAAARQAVVDAEDAAHTNVQFRRGRSWLERSINHPYLGVYPFSYMWGKVMPEMVRALALNPFGLPIPGLIEGATPGLGFLNAQRVWSSVEMQKDTDPEFRKFMNDPMNDKFFRGLAMMTPATPWDMPANYPLYARRLSEWGLESNMRREQGRQPKGFDAPKVAGDVASYAFGPASSLDWLSDVARWGNAPIIGQGTGEGQTSENLSRQVLQGGGKKAVTVEDTLKNAAGTLQNTLGPS